ncbi:MAG: NUDIX domain-containing protein [Chloroflexi bacterium]|nr:MAG: NUDIX domain-containing protein [Chloroflexota bacterium]TME15653.1 MAG: NUDIX domain-containing protein [Chloroflexota bacterium]
MTSSAEEPEPELRPAARVILLDAQGRILLFPWTLQDGRIIWLTPGGGLARGETHAQAALRELREETGVEDVALGPWVWRREHVFTWSGRRLRQRERFFVVRVDTAEVDTSRWEAHEREALGDGRWWTLEELRGSDAEFAPRRLAELLAPLINGRLPSRPVETGV